MQCIMSNSMLLENRMNKFDCYTCTVITSIYSHEQTWSCNIGKVSLFHILRILVKNCGCWCRQRRKFVKEAAHCTCTATISYNLQHLWGSHFQILIFSIYWDVLPKFGAYCIAADKRTWKSMMHHFCEWYS